MAPSGLDFVGERNQTGANGGGGLSNFELLQLLDNVRVAVRNRGFGLAVESEVMQAVQTLAKYDVLGVALSAGSNGATAVFLGRRNRLDTNL